MFFNQNRKTAKCLKNKKCYVVLIILCTLCFFFSRCIHRNIRNSEGTTVSFSQYAGSEKCATCHKAIYDSFLLTGHHLTSLVSDSTDIKGSFTPGENVFHYTANLLVEMENSDSGLYQVEYQNGKKVLARKFDITIGSGMRGQTYLSWNADILTQLPVSYLTSANSWANSPGDKDQVYFDRPVNSRCLECHATYAKVLPFRFMNGPEEFDRHKVILTISCEKCHGPGAKHVNWQTENPEARIAKYIIDPSQFSRQQSLDMCAVCHGKYKTNL